MSPLNAEPIHASVASARPSAASGTLRTRNRATLAPARSGRADSLELSAKRGRHTPADIDKLLLNHELLTRVAGGLA